MHFLNNLSIFLCDFKFDKLFLYSITPLFLITVTHRTMSLKPCMESRVQLVQLRNEFVKGFLTRRLNTVEKKCIPIWRK